MSFITSNNNNNNFNLKINTDFDTKKKQLFFNKLKKYKNSCNSLNSLDSFSSLSSYNSLESVDKQSNDDKIITNIEKNISNIFMKRRVRDDNYSTFRNLNNKSPNISDLKNIISHRKMSIDSVDSNIGLSIDS